MYKIIITICILIITVNNCINTYSKPVNLVDESLELNQLQQIELAEHQKIKY